MDEVLRQVIHIYTEETKEQAQRISAALLAMEMDASRVPTEIEELYRQAHSLKGSSSSLGVQELADLAHHLEDALTPLRQGRATLGPALVDVVLRAMDATRARADGLAADNDVGLVEIAAAIEELRALGAELGDRAPAETAAREPPEPRAVEERASEGGEESETLRVSATRLAALERRLDELHAVRGRLEHRAEITAALGAELEQTWREAVARPGAAPLRDPLYRALRTLFGLRRDLVDDSEMAQASAVELDENLRSLRLVPFGVLRQPLQRALRDACRRTGKEAHLELLHGEHEVDRRLLDQLKNPMLHLVRNAVDHGLESTEIRAAVGKPPEAKVTVSIEQRGRDIIVTVEDDGRGIDLAAVREKAVELGLYSETEAGRLDESELYEILFGSGFSTVSEVTELSGRGVGLDVVRNVMTRVHGRVEVSSEAGRGTRFQLWAPLTVAASETMLVEECGRAFALPQAGLLRIVRAQLSELTPTGGRTYYHLDDEPIPVVRLAHVLGLTAQHDASPWLTLAVVRSNERRAAVVCERLLGSRDLVLRPLPIELQGLRLLNAAATLPDGQPILVLSLRVLVEAAWEEQETSAKAGFVPPGTVLVADDSITTRALLRNALEASGYRVRVASDGDEAWRLCLSERIDVIISDVRMPRVDGFELTRRLKNDPRTAHTPVVLFSSLDSNEDKRRAAVSGARAYLTKGAYERGQLIDVVHNLIRGS